MQHNLYDAVIGKALDSMEIEWNSPKSNVFHTFHNVGGHKLKIIGQLPEGFPAVPPNFFLDNRSAYGQLAHVEWDSSGKVDFGTICYKTSDAVDIDSNRPGDIYLESLEESVKILENSLTDANYNQVEIFKEYMAVWNTHVVESSKIIVCAEPEINSVSELIIRYPNKQKNTKKFGVEQQIIAYSESSNLSSKNYLYNELWKSSSRRNDGKSVLISVDSLLPPPAPFEPISKWWEKQLKDFSIVVKDKLEKYKTLRSKVFYVFLHTIHNENPIWIGIKFEATKKLRAPLDLKDLLNWTSEVCSLSPISKHVLIPRAAGQVSFQDKTVCIVGCGSVGHQIASLLVKIGVGNLVLIDPDSFHFENIHKHALPLSYLHHNKALALKSHLEYNYPFVQINALNTQLTVYCSDEVFDSDVVVLATGNPSLERGMDQKIREVGEVTAVISAWNEPYGIGGHAQLSHSNTKGCLTCTFTDPSTEELKIGHNWLNFTTPGQNTLENIGGCGFEFIAFNAIDASKTSTLAAELVQKVLSGEIDKSIAVSWRGSNSEFIKRGLTTTHRYQATKEEILRTDRLYIAGCGNCSNE